MGVADRKHLLLFCWLIESLFILAQPAKLSGSDVLRTFLAVVLYIRVEFIAANLSTFHALGNGNHQCMEMRCRLVKVALEADDILLSELPAQEVIVVQSHRLNLLAPAAVRVIGKRNVTVVLLPVKIHRLAESNLRHAVVVATDDEIDAGVRLVRRILCPRFVVQFFQSLLVSLL
ncbi:MAG: hypothetical protein AUK63_2125 [bacterium P3]|nr:MAG: hypothetical protein AUK63_2125 [bacterium P3]